MRHHIPYVILLATWLGLAHAPHAQTPQIDSLEATLDTIQNDSLWVERHITLCLKRRKLNLDQGIACFESALEEVQQRGYRAGYAKIALRLGFSHELKGEFIVEMDLFMQALEIYTDLNDSAGLGAAYSALGNMYNILSDYAMAERYHRLSLDIRQRLGMDEAVAATYNNLGNIYLSQSMWEPAIEYYQKARRINEQSSNWEFLSNNFSNLGLAYDAMGDMDTAVAYHLRALDLRQRLGNVLAQAGSQVYLGRTYVHMGKPAQGLALLKQGMAVAEANGAQVLMEQGTLALYEAYKALGQDAAALKAHEQHLALRDALRQAEVSGQVARAQVEFEMKQRERESELRVQNQRLQETAARERERAFFGWVIGGVAILLAVVAVVALVLAFQYRAKKRMARHLEAMVQQRTAALKEANEELSRFIHQSSHDMRTPLTSIRGLTTLALESADWEAQQRYLSLIAEKAGLLDNVYSGLVEWMNVKDHQPRYLEVELRNVVDSALDRVSAMRPETVLQPQGAIDARLVADPYLLQVVLQSILLNVVDFTQTDTSPQCLIQYHMHEKGWELAIMDKGIGMLPEFLPRAFEMFQRGSARSRGAGLGLYIAQLAATKMGMGLHLQPRPGGGTVVVLQGKDPGTPPPSSQA